MKLVIADCSANYTGRGDANLSRGVRAILIKNDGSVSIHNEKGNKAVNYMKTASIEETETPEGNKLWIFESKDERLSITLYSIHMQTEMTLMENDPGAIKDGTEKHLQDWVFNNPEVLGEGYQILSKEFNTGKGSVDLFALDSEGIPVAVEIKRVAMMGAVDQTRRYVDSLKKEKVIIDRKNIREDISVPEGIDFSKTRGMVAALEIKLKTEEWADQHNIETVVLPQNWKELADLDKKLEENQL